MNGPARKLRGIHVLLIDNDQPERNFIRTVLESSGAVVTVASTADALRAALIADVIVCDLASAEMAGSEFLSQLCRAAGLSAPARGVYALAYAQAWLRELLRMPGLSRADVVRRGRSALFDNLGATRDLEYEPRVNIADGMAALTQWVSQLGGPDALARFERSSASASEVDALIRLADAG